MSDDKPLIYMPTKGQQIFISLIGIPMSALSITGSYFIIRHARKGRGSSPYRQIMIASSACDIIWSASFVLQPFLSDTSLEFQHEDQVWVWAFGNSDSCIFLGAMTQFGLSAHWFSGLISFYFLLTVRFGVRQATFAKILPFLIGGIILWSVGTAIAGAVLGHFHPLGSGPGCWVGGDGFCEGAECDETVLLGWIIGGAPTLLMLLSVIVNNLILYCHVRRTVLEGQRRALKAQKELERYSGPKPLSGRFERTSSKSLELQPAVGSKDSKSGFSNEMSISFNSRLSSKSLYKDADSVASSGGFSFASIINPAGETKTMPGRSSQKSLMSRFNLGDASVFSTGASVTPYKSSVLRSSEKQWKRVEEVGKQSFLYVGAYLLSVGWTFVMNFLDSQNFEFKENAESYFLPLLIFQSFCLPTMGFFNCCVYFRPKILSVSKEFPKESRIWKVQRAIYGNSIKPTPASARVIPRSAVPPETLRINFGGDPAMSSLARGDSDMDSMGSLTEADLKSGDQFDCSVIMEGEIEESSRGYITSDASQRHSSYTASKLETSESEVSSIKKNLKLETDDSIVEIAENIAEISRRRSLDLTTLGKDVGGEDSGRHCLNASVKLDMYESLHLGEAIDADLEESIRLSNRQALQESIRGSKKHSSHKSKKRGRVSRVKEEV